MVCKVLQQAQATQQQINEHVICISYFQNGKQASDEP